MSKQKKGGKGGGGGGGNLGKGGMHSVVISSAEERRRKALAEARQTSGQLSATVMALLPIAILPITKMITTVNSIGLTMVMIRMDQTVLMDHTILKIHGKTPRDDKLFI